MKNKKKIIIIIVASIIIITTAITAFFLFAKDRVSVHEKTIKAFYGSLLPDYNAQQFEQSVGSKAYQIRFNDNGYFVDRYERTRKQIVYYYGEDFKSTLSNFVVSDVSKSENSSITREYKSKYSLEISEIKQVSFVITLSSEHEEKSRTQSLTLLKINNDWFIYDYDAYWFAYM